ncbi:MAG TPA: LCP family protein [Amycolatopsis sp.]|nr:LCP family protein [Amycolatopsis sp.]
MRIAGKIVVALLALVVLAGTAYGYTTLGALDDVRRSSVIDAGETPAPGEQPADGALDILLVGRDSRTDQDGHPLPPDVLRVLRAGANGDDLTDTLIVLRIPNGRQAVKAFSIPRDSWVSMPGGMGKINAAYGRAKAAERKKLLGEGETDQDKIEQESLTAARRGTVEAVQNLTGVKIDHFAEVNLLSFYEISNAIGGVEVCLNNATKDPDSGANFPAGPQKISGADALAFVRQRHGVKGSDFGRMRRQQAFLASMAHQILSAGTLANPGRISDLISAVKKSVVLDDSWNLLDFAARMRGISGGGIQFSTIPIENPDYRYSKSDPKATAVQVDPAQVKAFAAGVIGAPAPATNGATVDVSNASGSTGLAARVSDVVKDKGFTPGTTGNAAPRRTSLVRFGSALKTQGEAVASLLGGLATSVSADVPAGHIQVLLGEAYHGPGTTPGGGTSEGDTGPGDNGIPTGGGAAAGSGPGDPPVTSAGQNCVD